MWKQHKPKVKFSLADADLKTINRLRKFNLYDIEMVENTANFSVSLAHKNAVTALLGKRTFTVNEPNNIFTLLNFFYTRAALVAMVVVCLASFIVTQQFVFRVRVEGLSGAEHTMVSTYLQSRGISGITPKRTAKKPDLAHDIVQQFPFVASTNIQIKGSKLIITINRAENVVPRIPTGDIICTVDGVIGDIVVFSGTPNVTVGDVVRKGDILVTGTRPTAIITIVNGGEVSCIINNTMI